MNHRTIAITAAMAVLASVPIAAQQETRPASAEVTYADKQLVAIYLDLTALSKEDLPRVVTASKKFLESRRAGTQLVALISYDGRSVRVGQDFTDDFDLLGRTVDQVLASGSNAVAASDADRAAALEQAVRMLGTPPQKKALVYFGMTTLGSPEQWEATIQAAVKANVAFFPIDVRGLAAGPGK